MRKQKTDIAIALLIGLLISPGIANFLVDHNLVSSGLEVIAVITAINLAVSLMAFSYLNHLQGKKLAKDVEKFLRNTDGKS